MKKILSLIPYLVLLSLTIIYKEDITDFIIEKIIFDHDNYTITPNEYAINHEFLYVKDTNNFTAYNFNDVISIIYTGLNSGANEFHFFCKYENCEYDMSLQSTDEILSILNNYVHPYNIFERLSISVDTFNKVEIKVDKIYSDNDISMIDNEMNKIINKIINNDMSIEEKITTFHDYIIEHTSYDSDYLENSLSNSRYPSHNAIGPLFYNKGLCGGYTNVMSIFLNKLNLPNYRISSSTHIWNFVKLNDEWLHIDLTWDDPITNTGEQIKLDKFLLIKTKELNSFDTGYHNFNNSFYLEANQN